MGQNEEFFVCVEFVHVRMVIWNALEKGEDSDATFMAFQCCLLGIHDGNTFAVVSVSTPITKIYIMYS